MDNLTHSLLGLAAAEGAWRLSQRRILGARNNGKTGANPDMPPNLTFRGALWLASFFANNFSDSDVFLHGLIPGRLGPLLQHRGYTHTLAGVIPGVILTLLMVAGWLRLRPVPRKLSRDEWRWIAGVAVFGIFLHLFADSWNVYGTHPFWPVSKRWIYGDFFFIAEPWVWMTFIPALFHASHGRDLPGKTGRAILLLLFVAALCAIWGLGFVPPAIAALLTLYGAGLLAWFLRKRARREPGAPISTSFVLLALILATFFGFGAGARSTMKRVAAGFPRAKLHDAVLSPLPADPLCWMVILVQTEPDPSGETAYVLRRGLYSAAPAVIPAERCISPRVITGLARLVPVVAPGMVTAIASPQQMYWQGE
ncbi:MAG: metal-dependent hydrolase, partial [Deltaproteobacteria bacterium]|nr:metal-dependent hydrolase [Deltaproteobacteria bacterium]